MFSRIKKSFFNDSELTILEIFKPLYVLLCLVGLFPYSVKFKTKHTCVIKQRSIYINSLCAASMIFIMLAFLALHIRGIVLLTDGNSLTDAIITQINYILELQALTIVCLVAYYCAFLYRLKYVKILNTLASLWLELPETGDNILQNLKLDVVKILISLVFILLLQIAVNFTRSDGLWKKILVTFSFNFPQMIQLIMLAFYYTLIIMVIALLKKIEESLKYLTKDRKNKTLFIKVDVRQPKTNLRDLEKTLVRIFDVKRSINKVFQASILVTAVQCFHAMVSEAHIIYHGVFIHQSLTTHEIINCSIWILYHILKIYILACSGSRLKMQAYKLGQILHNIPVEKQQDAQSYLQIQHFASLMSYQATDLTVYGYFPLDATLMFKVIASSTMYLIIMVQFDKKA